MVSMDVGAVLTILCLYIATASAADGGVTFWRTTFTMTCPIGEKWYKEGDPKSVNSGETYEMKYDNSKKGLYYCQKDKVPTQKYYFYVKGKVCDNCFELDPLIFGLALTVDVVATVVVLVVVYRCGKRKSSAGHSNASKGSAFSGGRGPPLPTPDYEQLGPRNQDPYSMLNT